MKQWNSGGALEY